MQWSAICYTPSYPLALNEHVRCLGQIVGWLISSCSLTQLNPLLGFNLRLHLARWRVPNDHALKFWKEYDDTVFKLAHEKRGSWLQEHRTEDIQKLNADYFKPRFPVKKDGRVVDDLGDMTFEETVLHLLCLMCVAHEDCWLDLSLHNLMGDWPYHIT